MRRREIKRAIAVDREKQQYRILLCKMYSQQCSSSRATSPRWSGRKRIAKDFVEGKEEKSLRETEKGAERTKALLNEAENYPKIHVLDPRELKVDGKEDVEVLWLVSPRLRAISSPLSNASECTRRCDQRTSRRISSNCSRTTLVSCSVVSDEGNPKSSSSRVIQATTSPQHTSLEKDSRSLRESWSRKLMTLSPRTERNEHLKKGRGMSSSCRSRIPQDHRGRREKEEGELNMEASRLRSCGGITLGRKERKRARITPENRASKEDVLSSPPINFSTLVPCASLWENEDCLEEAQKEREADSRKLMGISVEKMNPSEGRLGETSVQHDKEGIEEGRKKMLGRLQMMQPSVNPLDPVPSLVSIERVDKGRDKDKGVEGIERKEKENEEAMRGEQWRHFTTFSDMNSPEDSSSLDLCSRTLFVPPYSFSCFTDPLLKQSELKKEQYSCEFQEENTDVEDKSEKAEKERKKSLSEEAERLSTSPLPSSCTQPLDLSRNLNTESSGSDVVLRVPLRPTTCTPLPIVSSPVIQASFSSNTANESLCLSSSRIGTCVDEKNTSLRVSDEAADQEEFGGLEVREDKTPSDLRKESHQIIHQFFSQRGEEDDLLEENVRDAKNADENSIYSFPLSSSSPPSLSPTPPPLPSPSTFSTSKNTLITTTSSNEHEDLSIREDELRAQVYELFMHLHVFFS